jgi:LPXTG-site transpeptidase (sortase) family protein
MVLSLIGLTAMGAVPTLRSAVSDSNTTEVTYVDRPTIEESTDTATPAPAVVTDALPLTLAIDALDREVTVLNPESSAIADLDAALLSGVVRHPDSATFADTGNMFILGHSSYLPTVRNKNYQAFNGLQNLKAGDVVRLRSASVEYLYTVEKVYKAKAQDVEVPLSGSEARLTLATCNSFGSKDDRYIVEAVLTDEKPL